MERSSTSASVGKFNLQPLQCREFTPPYIALQYIVLQPFVCIGSIGAPRDFFLYLLPLHCTKNVFGKVQYNASHVRATRLVARRSSRPRARRGVFPGGQWELCGAVL